MRAAAAGRSVRVSMRAAAVDAEEDAIVLRREGGLSGRVGQREPNQSPTTKSASAV